MYGADEPPHPVLAALSVIFGSLAGLTFGVAGFLLGASASIRGTRAFTSFPES